MSKKKEFIKIGKCIWCLKEKPQVTFSNIPHTISKKLGATNVGSDICDSCNHYFGTNNKDEKYPMAVDLAFKEIMAVMRIMLKNDFNENTYKTFGSIYFDYHHKNKSLKIRRSFELRPLFISHLTRQFKRGAYETFLQEYHRVTSMGLEDKFDSVRQFVRNDKGNLPIYYMENKGVYLVEQNIDSPTFSFNEKILSDINDYGFYIMMLFGNIFFLEVTPRAEITREIFLHREFKKLAGTGFVFSGLKEMKYITDLDFTLRKLHG